MGSLSQLSNKLLVVIDCDQVHSQSADSSSIASPSPLGVKARGACVDIFSLFSCFILSLCFFFFFLPICSRVFSTLCGVWENLDTPGECLMPCSFFFPFLSGVNIVIRDTLP